MVNNFERANRSPAEEIYDALSAMSGKIITVPGELVDMPDNTEVSVEIVSIFHAAGEGRSPDRTEFSIGVIPTEWKEASPDGDFGARAISIDLENSKEFIREHGGD